MEEVVKYIHKYEVNAYVQIYPYTINRRNKEMNDPLKLSISNEFRNTKMGFIRIKKNLDISDLSDNKTERYLKEIILTTPLEEIESIGKNHYFKNIKYNAILTVNSHTFTIITAKKIGNNDFWNISQK